MRTMASELTANASVLTYDWYLLSVLGYFSERDRSNGEFKVIDM